MPITDTLLPIFRSRTLARVAFYAVLMGAYGAIPVWKENSPLELYGEPLELYGDVPSQIHVALTLVLGWLLVFRTNSAYDRWWEARTLWGALVNASRNLAAKVCAIPGLTSRDRSATEKNVIAFAYALRDHLRDEPSIQSLPGFENYELSTQHAPNHLMQRVFSDLWRWKSEGRIDGDELRVLDAETHRFLDICGGCERIRKTRIARSYRVFARQCIFFYLATFPWGIVHEFGIWTIPLTAITAYFMLGLETVAEHVEEPFGTDEDDLNLDGLCVTIDESVREIFAMQEEIKTDQSQSK